MLKLLRKVNLWNESRGRYVAKRLFLSNAYKCREAWDNRLKHPVCEKIDFENVYYNLDLTFKSKNRINILDIDFYATSLTNLDYKNELEDILIKLRETPECVLLPDRTVHAIIRLYMDHGSKEELFNLLGNRLIYGLFPDNYLNNLLMDEFIKKNDAVSAVKIAVLEMLQENFEHPITKALALYSCYNYLASPQVWEYQENVKETEDDDEVQKVRVKYLKNPYFDDHFDIKNVNHLIGKTLWMFGLSVNSELGASSQLLGLVLYGKYEKCISYLTEINEKSQKLYSEAVKMSKMYIVNPPKEESSHKCDSEPKEENSKVENNSSETEQATNVDSIKQKVINLLDNLNKKNLIDGDILLASENAVKEAVKSNEEKDISFQCQLYKNWESEREKDVQEEINRDKLEKLKGEIDKTKEELKKEEEKLFFFDKEEELDLQIAENEKLKESVVFYKEKKKKHGTGNKDDAYNPPDVHQKPAKK